MPNKKGFIVLTVLFEREEGGSRWVATCRELGTSTYGSTLDEAKERIEEAIGLHLNTLEDVGERARFFEENNIKVLSEKPGDEIEMTVPIQSQIFSQPMIRQLAMANN